MQIFKYGAIGIISFFALAILFFALKSRRPLRFLLLNAIIGIIAMIVVNTASQFTGVYIPVNRFSVSGVSVFGVPAVIGLIILQIIC